FFCFFFQAEDGIRDDLVTGVQTCALPICSPIYLAGLARPGPTRRENRAVHAVSRIMLDGAISSIQCSWVKLGPDLCREVLAGGEIGRASCREKGGARRAQ